MDERGGLYRVCWTIVRENASQARSEDTTHLLEANSIGLLAEALTAEVKTVLANETGLVGAVTATRIIGSTHYSLVIVSQRERELTTGGSPFRTCGDERTKRRRGSFWRVNVV